MSRKTLFAFLIVIIVTFLISSCSNPAKDYEPIQQFQRTTELSITGTSDDVSNIKSCQNVIDALQNFTKDHPEGEWNLTAKTALTSWQTKKDSLQEVVKSKSDFDRIQKLQDATENIMQYSFDYDVRTKSCEDMTQALEQFLSKHPKSEWNACVQTALMSWKSKEDNLVRQLGSLFNKLYNVMEQRATDEAKKVHPRSAVEKVQIESSNTNTTGGNIQVIRSYAIRMHSTLVSKDIFKLDITVYGNIVPESKQVFIDDYTKVDE